MVKRSGLFIVDNSDEYGKALECLRKWREISESIDIATGHFEMTAFLALDAEWQEVSKVRLLAGGETSRQPADAIAAALDSSHTIEREEDEPFLTGIEAVVDAIRNYTIQIAQGLGISPGFMYERLRDLDPSGWAA